MSALTIIILACCIGALSCIGRLWYLLQTEQNKYAAQEVKRLASEEMTKYYRKEYMAAQNQNYQLTRKLQRLTDRDEKGRFVKAEKPSTANNNIKEENK